ncbi:MAG: hypothetical protein HBSAPP03_02140 [Phycisphaerae bacterium]|nr:MAG: hypothetical protein HBSAPP03_02140 [Phycisphaerae bacterium]
MTRNRFHPALSWLCLIWFGLTNTLFAGGMVVCRDGHGGSRIEWGCTQNANNECVTSCGSDADEPEDDTEPAHPCDDTPIKGDPQLTKASLRTTSHELVPVQGILAAITIGFDPPPPSRHHGYRDRPPRPPDSLRCLRAVILLV